MWLKNQKKKKTESFQILGEIRRNNAEYSTEINTHYRGNVKTEERHFILCFP